MPAQGVAFALEFGQITPCLGRDRLRDPRERGDLQAVTLVRRTFPDGVQQHEPLAVLDRLDVHVGDAARLGGKTRELEIMRRE
jgi:hypothetical protein